MRRRDRRDITITVEESRCTGCSYCVIACPQGRFNWRSRREPGRALTSIVARGAVSAPTSVPTTSSLCRRSRPRAVELAQRYDVVIIGAGIGGLMTAAGLARAGKKVLVLEQLSFVGGKYTHLDAQGLRHQHGGLDLPRPPQPHRPAVHQTGRGHRMDHHPRHQGARRPLGGDEGRAALRFARRGAGDAGGGRAGHGQGVRVDERTCTIPRVPIPTR